MFSKAFLEEVRRDAERVRSPQAESTPVPEGFLLPTFWVPESISPLSAIVRENGVQTFSAHAHKPFFSWPELLGAEWVKQFEDGKTGAAIEGIKFDGRSFYVRKPCGRWDDEPARRAKKRPHWRAARVREPATHE